MNLVLVYIRQARTPMLPSLAAQDGGPRFVEWMADSLAGGQALSRFALEAVEL